MLIVYSWPAAAVGSLCDGCVNGAAVPRGWTEQSVRSSKHAAAAGAGLRALLALASLRQVTADAATTRLGEVARVTPPLTLPLALAETYHRVLVRVDSGNPVDGVRRLRSLASRGFRRSATLPVHLRERLSAQSTPSPNYLASLYQRDAPATLAALRRD